MWNVLGLAAGLIGAILIAVAQSGLFSVIRLWLLSLDFTIETMLDPARKPIVRVTGVDEHMKRATNRNRWLSTVGWIFIALSFVLQLVPYLPDLMRRIVSALVLPLTILCFSHIASHAQPKPSQSAHTTDITIACPKDEDFNRYATLLLDDVSAAILFKNDHHCVTLAAGTFVRIDQGSLQRETNHVCVRPVGSYDCLWTFAGHLKAESNQ